MRNPIQTGFFDTRFGSSKIYFRNDTLFVAGSGGLELYYISNPHSAAFLNAYRTEYPSLDLTLEDDHIVLLSGMGGVDIISISSGLNRISHIDVGGDARSAKISGNRMYIAESDSGVSAWDINDWAQPAHLADFQTAGKAYDLEIFENKLYVADFYGITMIELPWEDINFDYKAETRSIKENNLILFPNPVNKNGTVFLSVSSENLPSIDLYDILGRKVKSVKGNSMSGGQEIKLGGLSSGVYFFRIDHGLLS